MLIRRRHRRDTGKRKNRRQRPVGKFGQLLVPSVECLKYELRDISKRPSVQRNWTQFMEEASLISSWDLAANENLQNGKSISIELTLLLRGLAILQSSGINRGLPDVIRRILHAANGFDPESDPKLNNDTPEMRLTTKTVWKALDILARSKTINLMGEWNYFISEYSDEVTQIISGELGTDVEGKLCPLKAVQNNSCDQTKSSGPVVTLGKLSESPTVFGREKLPLTPSQYDVIRALLNAGERGLSKDTLDRNSGRSEARKILKGLAKSDEEWNRAILFPGKAWRGYRLMWQ